VRDTEFVFFFIKGRWLNCFKINSPWKGFNTNILHITSITLTRYSSYTQTHPN